MQENKEFYSKEYVLKNGIDFENLWFSSYSDEILDNPEDEGGEPFTGLTYELYDNGELIYFCFYKDGLAHGLKREFYKSGNIKCEKPMKYGLINGKSFSWYENGNIESMIEYELSIPICQKKWDENGTLIFKKEIKEDKSDDNYAILLKRREINQALGRE
ncbi:toxin-antitoxin system YwqK family antitoxin [Scopulibacillus cellulosilyticus]|uniref:Toxin-antitoxin system YwqK family antitoxin n=1 Tax=Scopulibacillus cellulosilyticus TaxID=2665665 RepID=A0ABW2Q653_9BACL